MSIRVVCLISIGLALSATVAAGADTALADKPPVAREAASGGGRPLPHPDILSLPAQPPAAPTAANESSPAAAVPTPVQASESHAASSETKEIARRGGTANNARSTDSESRSLDRHGLLRDLWPLLAVLVLIAGITVFLKKFLPARRLMAGSQVLRIVARTHVTPKQQLMLVKLGRRMVLLGVSPDRISTLSTVDDPDQVALLLGEAASSQPNSSNHAFAASMREEKDSYEELPDEDATSATRGQVHGLLEKVRSLAGKTG